jgi:hypothetical protein
VVDPGVGTERAILCIEWPGQRLVVPDNGCWTHLIQQLGVGEPVVYRLTEHRYWRPPVSDTFHGRDILAPVAGHLTLGVPPSALGPRTRNWVRLDLPRSTIGPDEARGEILAVDRFGNLISNIPVAALPPDAKTVPVRVVDQLIGLRVRTYGEAPHGTLVALTSSSGMLEIAVSHGSAAERLRCGAGASVVVRFRP